jgi:hypothetical protein
MISRIMSTAVLVLLAAGALLSQATFAEPSDSTVFLFFGAVTLFLALLNWLAWPTIRAGWEAGLQPGEAGPDLPVSASFWPVYVGGLLNALSAAGLHRAKPGAAADNSDRRS